MNIDVPVDPQARNREISDAYIDCVAIARTWFDTVAPHRRVLALNDQLSWLHMTQRIGSELLFLRGRSDQGLARLTIEFREQMQEIGFSTTRDRDVMNLRSIIAVVDMLRGNTRRMDAYRAAMTMSMNGCDPR